MERLSKLTGSVSLRDIDFSAFSSSSKWVGYFEKKNDFSFLLVDKAISLFEGYFNSQGENIIVMSALSFDDEREDDREVIKRFQSLYEEMKCKKMILQMSDDFEGYLYGESSLPVSAVSLSVEITDFKKLSRLIMCHAGIIGQVCFYINPSLNIAIYPHEDVGFGCVSLNYDDKSCRDFLKYCSRSENFNVYFNDAE